MHFCSLVSLSGQWFIQLFLGTSLGTLPLAYIWIFLSFPFSVAGWHAGQFASGATNWQNWFAESCSHRILGTSCLTKAHEGHGYALTFCAAEDSGESGSAKYHHFPKSLFHPVHQFHFCPELQKVMDMTAMWVSIFLLGEVKSLGEHTVLKSHAFFWARFEQHVYKFA